MTCVTRLMKDALPSDVSVTKEARSALTRAASVFILYLTTTASGNAASKKLKTLQAAHILEALEEIEFEEFVAPLKEFLEQYRSSQKEKRESKGAAAAKPAKSNDTTPTKKSGNDDDVEVFGDGAKG